MLELLKKLLTKTTPLWAHVITIVVVYSFVWFITPNPPPKVLIPLQINGVERILDLQKDLTLDKLDNYNKYINRFLLLQIMEYQSIFTIIYGSLDKDEVEAFDKIIKRLSK